MTLSKKTLFITFCIALVFHLGGLFFLYHFEMKASSSPLQNGRSLLSGELQKIKERTTLLCKIYDTLQKSPTQRVESFSNLKSERAPTPKVRFPEGKTLQLKGESFSLKAQAPKHTKAPPLFTPTSAPQFATPEEKGSSHTLAHSDHFDISVEYTPKRSRPGYVFKIVLTPKNDVLFKRIRQNYTFLIDRSNSIPRKRYLYNKQAVLAALEELSPGDTFNILLFDGHISSMSSKALPYSYQSLQQAKEFLIRQNHGGFFAATDLYSSLGKIVPQTVSDQELNTAILLSDGDTYLSLEKKRKLIGEWTAKNQGKVALHSITSGNGNNIELLELISSFNKGMLVYATDHKEVGKRLAQFMRMIQYPIGKDLMVTAVSKDPSLHLQITPSTARLPDLYKHRSYTLYGSTNRLSDFVLFLQGSYYNEQFTIKKTISFEPGQVGSFNIESDWIKLMAQTFYERYFEDGKIGHLEAAKELLAPLNLPVPLLSQ